MAQKVQVILVDDVDGSEADETVSFSLDGVAYEIDLKTENAQQMRDALAPYVGSARRVGGRAAGGRGRSRSNGRSNGSGGNRTAQIREWAKANGQKINDRGRIPASVV